MYGQTHIRYMCYLIDWGLSLLWCKFTWSRELDFFCTDSLFGLVFFCVYSVNLRCADEYVIVLGNLRRLFACLWDYVVIQLFFTLLVVFYYSMLGLLIQLFWLFYFALYFGWLTTLHKTPSSVARRLKGPRNDIVPVLGTTLSIATLLSKRPEGSI